IRRYDATAALHDFNQPPAFQLAQGTSLFNANQVTYLTGIFFIMGIEAFCLLVCTFVDTMLFQRFHCNDNGFIHFIADNHADLTLVARLLLYSLGCLLCHASASNCDNLCSTRAMSLRVCVNTRLFLISPRCCCKRRLKSLTRKSFNSRCASPSVNSEICLRRSLAFGTFGLPSC